MAGSTYTNPADMVSSGLQSYDTTTGIIVGRTITGTAGKISVSNGSGVAGNPTITLTNPITTGGIVFGYTGTAVSPYVVLVTDFVIGVDCSGAIKTVHLPNAPTTGSTWVIKDVTGSSGANAISITTPGGVVLIDAAATYTLNVAYASITVTFNGSSYVVW